MKKKNANFLCNALIIRHTKEGREGTYKRILPNSYFKKSPISLEFDTISYFFPPPEMYLPNALQYKSF